LVGAPGEDVLFANRPIEPIESGRGFLAVRVNRFDEPVIGVKNVGGRYHAGVGRVIGIYPGE
jgi:hypothetical protein